jgi:hypothetical protein
MAGINEKRVTDGINWGGYTDLGNGMGLYAGSGVFTTTGTTVTIYHPFTQVFSAQATLLTAAYGVNDQLTFTLGTAANTTKQDSTYGILTFVTAGTAQVLRNSSGTSGGAFTILMVGRAKH